MLESFLQVLGAALAIWESKEKTKYVDQYLSLKKRYYDEYNKDPSIRDDSVLDRIEFELRILGIAFASGVGKPNSPDKPNS